MSASTLLKRAFDITFASGVLLATWPVLLLAALAIRAESPGPIIYRARRAGAGGRPFEMFKLRTMRVGRDSFDRRITAARDDRITRVGRLLRASKLDELPQFWNVLRGDMTVVGPRPEDWDLVQRYYTPEQRRILEVRPGVVSTVEVLWYPDLTYHDPPPDGVSSQEWYVRRHLPVQVNEAARYLQERGFLLDLKVVAKVTCCVILHSWVPPKRRPPALIGDVGLPAPSTR